jgi:hypothetical protein
VIMERAYQRATEAICVAVSDSIETAMNRYNQRI